jgi:hypothetical protein
MDFLRAAARVAASESRPRWAGSPGANLEEMGMSAEFGPDEGMTSTHTMLEQDDLENVDTRPDQGSPCQHGRSLPGDGVCPDCGGQLVMLEGW